MRVTDLPWWYHRVRANEDLAERQAFCELAIYAHGSDSLYAKVRYRENDHGNEDTLMTCERSIFRYVGAKLLGTTPKNILTVYASAFSNAATLDEFMWHLDHEEVHAKENRDNAVPPGLKERYGLLSQVGAFDFVVGPELDEKLLLAHFTQWKRNWSECNAYLAEMVNENARVIRPELLVDTISNYLSYRVRLDAYNAMFVDNPVLNGLLGTARDLNADSYKEMPKEVPVTICNIINAVLEQEPPTTTPKDASAVEGEGMSAQKHAEND